MIIYYFLMEFFKEIKLTSKLFFIIHIFNYHMYIYNLLLELYYYYHY